MEDGAQGGGEEEAVFLHGPSNPWGRGVAVSRAKLIFSTGKES